MSTFVQNFLRLCVKSPEHDSTISGQICTKLDAKSQNETRNKSIRLTEQYDLLGNQLISEYINREIWNKALRQLQRHDQCIGSKNKRKKEKIRQRLICGANEKLKERNSNNTLTVPKQCYNSFTHVNVSQQFPETTVNQDSNRHSQLNEPVFNLFVFLAREGVKVNGLFRRPGNIADMKSILLNLSKGITITWSDYNIYTVANVAKRFLICLPHGIFGKHGENLLLRTARMRCSSVYENSGLISARANVEPEDRVRLEAFCNVVNSLPGPKKELTILTFGILYNMVENVNKTNLADVTTQKKSSTTKDVDEGENLSPYNGENWRGKENINDTQMNPEKLTIAEGIAKSVAGSLFHSCAHAVSEVDNATIIIRSLLLNFACLPNDLKSIYEDSVTGRMIPLKDEKTRQDNQDISPVSAGTNHHHQYQQQHHFSIRQNLRVYAERLLCLSTTGQTAVKLHSNNKTNIPDVSGSKRLLCHAKNTGDKASFSSYTKASFEMSSDARDSSVSAMMNQLAMQHQQQARSMDFLEKSTQTSRMSSQNSKNNSFKSSTGCGVNQTRRPLHISSVNWHESVDEAESNSSAILINFATPVQLKSRPSLVRRHSRYKSIQRRQMATLALKSAWFLAEQPVPVICLPDDFNEVLAVTTHSRKSSEKSDSIRKERTGEGTTKTLCHGDMNDQTDHNQNCDHHLSTISLIDMHEKEFQNQIECSIHLAASAIDMIMYSSNDISPAFYDQDEMDKYEQDKGFDAFLQPCPSLLSLQSAPDKFDNTSNLQLFDVVGFNFVRPYTWPSTFIERGLTNQKISGNNNKATNTFTINLFSSQLQQGHQHHHQHQHESVTTMSTSSDEEQSNV